MMMLQKYDFEITHFSWKKKQNTFFSKEKKKRQARCLVYKGVRKQKHHFSFFFSMVAPLLIQTYLPFRSFFSPSASVAVAGHEENKANFAKNSTNRINQTI